jgi:type IV pilus assembly protein PilV
LFSIGIVGMVSVQARATQASVGAEDSARAALLANGIAADMWLARSVTLPASAVSDWNGRVANPTGGGLPNGVGTVEVASGVATIRVEWRTPGASASSAYQTQVQLP